MSMRPWPFFFSFKYEMLCIYAVWKIIFQTLVHLPPGFNRCQHFAIFVRNPPFTVNKQVTVDTPKAILLSSHFFPHPPFLKMVSVLDLARDFHVPEMPRNLFFSLHNSLVYICMYAWTHTEFISYNCHFSILFMFFYPLLIDSCYHIFVFIWSVAVNILVYLLISSLLVWVSLGWMLRVELFCTPVFSCVGNAKLLSKAILYPISSVLLGPHFRIPWNISCAQTWIFCQSDRCKRACHCFDLHVPDYFSDFLFRELSVHCLGPFFYWVVFFLTEMREFVTYSQLITLCQLSWLFVTSLTNGPFSCKKV